MRILIFIYRDILYRLVCNNIGNIRYKKVLPVYPYYGRLQVRRSVSVSVVLLLSLAGAFQYRESWHCSWARGTRSSCSGDSGRLSVALCVRMSVCVCLCFSLATCRTVSLHRKASVRVRFTPSEGVCVRMCFCHCVRMYPPRF